MWKLVLGLLLSYCMTQIISQQEVIEILRNDSTYAADGYQTIPVDHLDSLHRFIKEIIEISYPTLKEWLLADIKEKYDNETDQTLYLYTYIDVVYGPENISNVVNISSVPVIKHQNNTLFTIFQGSTPVDTYAAPNQSPPRSPFVGGFSPANVSNLTSIQSDARDFILASVPELANWTLVAVKTQVVAGQNICFIFEEPNSNKTEEFCVFSQVWRNNYMRLTLPDGTSIQVGGLSTQSNHNNTTSTDNSNSVEVINSPAEGSDPPQSEVSNSSPLVGILPPSNRRLQIEG